MLVLGGVWEQSGLEDLSILRRMPSSNPKTNVFRELEKYDTCVICYMLVPYAMDLYNILCMACYILLYYVIYLYILCTCVVARCLYSHRHTLD